MLVMQTLCTDMSAMTAQTRPDTSFLFLQSTDGKHCHESYPLFAWELERIQHRHR